jgi:tetratricopeptide (TPR) repeat protein
VLTVSCLIGTPLAAVEQGSEPALELSPESLSAFASLQDEWLEWLAASYRANSVEARKALDLLLADARTLGMQRLPDLSVGAAGRAVDFASQGDFEVARWCLVAAERLDPGRPETSFAGARVAHLQGDYFSVVSQLLTGYSRLFRVPLLRSLWLSNLALWLLAVVLATGALFVAVLMATRGAELLGDLIAFGQHFVTAAVGLVLGLALLLWPVLLPAGLLWLVIYWSILLWGYSSVSEKVLLIVLWILLGVTPILLNEQRQRVQVGLAPATVSMEDLAEGSLKGSLFRDLTALQSALPNSDAVRHLLADLHCRLGEWEPAKILYREVLTREPRNTTALINAGVCYFRTGDHIRAIDYFQQATATEGPTAAAHFNLSQAFSELYRFSDANRELRTARSIDSASVGGWLELVETEGVVMLSGGVERSDEVRQELRGAWTGNEKGSRWRALWPSTLGLPLAVAFVGIAGGLNLVIRRGRKEADTALHAAHRSTKNVWLQVLLCGLPELEAEWPVRAFVSLLVPVALVTLPLVGVIGYRLPILFAPGRALLVMVALLGLALYAGFRYVAIRRMEG